MADPMTTLQATDNLEATRTALNANFTARQDLSDNEVAAAYTMLADDEAIYVDASGGAVTVTLLPTASARANQRVLVYALDATSTITIAVDDAGTETIGTGVATSMTLTAAEHFVELIRKGSGTAWLPLSRRN